MVIINLGPKYRNEYLSLTGLGVAFLRFTEMSFTGLSVTGLSVTGPSVTGLSVTGLSILGFMFDILTVICRSQSHACTFHLNAGIGKSAYYFNNVHNLFFEILCLFTLC